MIDAAPRGSALARLRVQGVTRGLCAYSIEGRR